MIEFTGFLNSKKSAGSYDSTIFTEWANRCCGASFFYIYSQFFQITLPIRSAILLSSSAGLTRAKRM